MNNRFEKGAEFVWLHGRLLERAVFAYRCLGGPVEPIYAALRAYQNPDGGFGHALEPDLRAPESQPLYVEFALRTLYDNGLRDVELAGRACDFIAAHGDLRRGIPTLLPSAAKYPRAGHWENPAAFAFSRDRLSGLVGLVSWQGPRHPWLEEAVAVCLAETAVSPHEDAHTIANAFCLLESQSGLVNVDGLYARLGAELLRANFFCLETPVRTYGLTPLAFAPTPGAYCRPLFSAAQIDAHLAELEAGQESDGGWPLQWGPPGATALLEWRAHRTVYALATLRAYGRI